MIESFKYTILRLVRNRSNLFWILLFPIILGTLFKVAFSNLGAAENFEPIPVAIVISEETDNITRETFCTIADGLSEKGDSQMLESTYCTKEEAMKMLEAKEIDGILFLNGNLQLTISANMNNKQMNQSILSSFVNQYNIDSMIFKDTAAGRPENLPYIISQMFDSYSCREEVNYAYHDSDSYTQYFYNLIGMACLFTAMGGVSVALDNQGNLSTRAARKNVSPTSKGITIAAEIFTHAIVEFLLNLLGFLFIVFVLRIDMTTRIGLAVLSIFIATLTGISLGFFIGSFGKKSENFKISAVFIIVLPCCFFSGLMMGNMRMIVENHAPWFNRINPAALISDSFYSLTAYESLSRYFQNIGTLLLLALLFSIGGILLTRRNRYASL